MGRPSETIIMAKQKNTPPSAVPAADSQQTQTGTPAEGTDPDTASGVTDEADGAGSLSADGAPEAAAGAEPNSDGVTGDAESAPPPEGDPLSPAADGTVPALVLSDNHLGKVGQVIQVKAAHAEALRLGGLIDPHPNAIKAATPEE